MPANHNDTLAGSRRTRSRAAFTTVELLVSIAIIFVLVTTAFVALKKGRSAATRTGSLNSLRQMGMAWTAYANAHNGRLLPGYPDVNVLTGGPTGTAKLDIKAETKEGKLLNPEDTQSYVWRLAPYLDYSWKTYMTDYASSSLESRFSSELDTNHDTCYGPGTNDPHGNLIGAALAPSFGLNSTFLGGDSFNCDGATKAKHPWTLVNNEFVNPGRIAALRMSEIMNPAQTIVFGAARFNGVGDLSSLQLTVNETKLGYCHLCPPFTLFDHNANMWTHQHWMVDATSSEGVAANGMNNVPMGIPYDRIGVSKTVPIVNADGSTASEAIFDLSGQAPADAAGDPKEYAKAAMKRWAPYMP